MGVKDMEPTERKVYDFLREHGENPLSKITAHTGIEFVDLFNVLKALKDKRYVTLTPRKGGIPYYSAVPLDEEK